MRLKSQLNVKRPGEIVATKGARHVAMVTSWERGATVTVVCAINVYFSTEGDGGSFDEGATPASVGYCSPNGWIDADLFIKLFEHFAASTNARTENQQIVIIDGHHSHKPLAAITFARYKV